MERLFEMALEEIMKKGKLLKEGFKEVTTGKISILYKSCLYQETIIYFEYQKNLYKKARKLG
jgi:hypothetical protein